MLVPALLLEFPSPEGANPVLPPLDLETLALLEEEGSDALLPPSSILDFFSLGGASSGEGVVWVDVEDSDEGGDDRDLSEQKGTTLITKHSCGINTRSSNIENLHTATYLRS